MTDFPAGDPDIPDAALTNESLGTMHGGLGHPAATNRLTANVKALGAKIGYGASLPGGTSGLLRRTASGQSAWGTVLAGDYGAGSIANADVSPTAGIAKTKLGALAIVDADVAAGAGIAKSKLGALSIVDADVAAGAGIAKSKLGALAIVDADVAAGAAISKAKLAALAIVNADVASGAAIDLAKLLHVGTGNILKSNGANNVAGQLANADVAPTAAIDISKVAHVGTGNVLKSNGTINVAGQVANADISPTAAMLVSKLSAGGVANRALMTVDGAATQWGLLQAAMVNAGGTGNRLLRTSDGANAVWGQLADADIALNSISAGRLAAAGVANRVVATADGATTVMQQVATSMIAAGAIHALAVGAFVAGTSYNGSTSSPIAMSSACSLTTVGGDVLVFAYLSLYANAAPGNIALQVTMDGTAYGYEMYYNSVAVNGWQPITLCMWLTAGAGAHSFGVNWRPSASIGWFLGGGQVIALELKR